MNFSCIWCWLIPLIVGAICAYLGYLIGRRKGDVTIEALNKKVTDLKSDLEACRKKRLSLESDLDACNKSKLSLESKGDDSSKFKSQIAQLEADLAASNKNILGLQSQGNDSSDLKVQIAKLEADLSACRASKPVVEVSNFDANAAKAVFGKKIKQDDLKVVEGIGPKIEGLFHNFNIKTWKALSEASIEKCQEVLNSGGERYKIHNPGTWPKQSQLAYEGKWAELLKWQDELDGGKA